MAQHELLSSRQNPRVKAAAALKDASERRKTGLFLAEGARLCADAAAFGTAVETLFITEEAALAYPAQYRAAAAAAKEVFFVSREAAEKLSDTASSQHFFCVCRQKTAPAGPIPAGNYLVTDRIQNPDNLGALSRSAEAFGAAGMIAAGGCDIYSPKALRASMGALLRFPVWRAPDCAEALLQMKAAGFRTFAAVLGSRSVDIRTVTACGPKALVIGNEGEGVSPAAAAACTDLVVIPMAGRAESLNAAAAGAVLLWELFGKEAPTVN